MTPAMISACERLVGEDVDGIVVPVFFKGQEVPANVSSYVRFFVLPSEDTVPIGIGETAKSRNIGIVQANVYGPRSKGGGPTHRIATVIWKALSRLQMEVLGEGAIFFKEGSVLDMDITGEEYLHITRVPYRYDFRINP
jgi:hypothetical protein